MLNHNFLTCADAEILDLTVCIVVNGEKFQSHAEILDLTVCIVVNGEKFQSHAATFTLIGQCPMLINRNYNNLIFIIIPDNAAPVGGCGLLEVPPGGRVGRVLIPPFVDFMVERESIEYSNVET